MNCIKCGAKTKVKDTRHALDVSNMFDPIIYRQRVCPKCNHIMYTIEFEVDNDEKFTREYRRANRVRYKKKGVDI